MHEDTRLPMLERAPMYRPGIWGLARASNPLLARVCQQTTGMSAADWATKGLATPPHSSACSTEGCRGQASPSTPATVAVSDAPALRLSISYFTFKSYGDGRTATGSPQPAAAGSASCRHICCALRRCGSSVHRLQGDFGKKNREHGLFEKLVGCSALDGLLCAVANAWTVLQPLSPDSLERRHDACAALRRC
eukprot:311633-Chlamydomonas_euryale.AAC.8